jgi:hypothetical protein
LWKCTPVSQILERWRITSSRATLGKVSQTLSQKQNKNTKGLGGVAHKIQCLPSILPLEARVVDKIRWIDPDGRQCVREMRLLLLVVA